MIVILFHSLLFSGAGIKAVIDTIKHTANLRPITIISDYLLLIELLLC